MKWNTILFRYLFLELLPPFWINLVFFSFVFLMTQILEITNMVVNYGMGVSRILLMMLYNLPFFLQFIIPMSVMLSILLTFLRLSGDNEITALKAGGISIHQLLPPVMAFCLIGCLLTGFMGIYGLPWGRTAFKQLAIDTAERHLDFAIKERTFNDSFKGVMLYVTHMDTKTRTMTDVFIEDQRNANIISTVVAPKGSLILNAERRSVLLRLYNGTINQVDIKNRSVNTVRFATYDINLDAGQRARAIQHGPKDEEEMSLAELREYLAEDRPRDRQYYLTWMEYHKKFSLPFACLALGILAVPLGIQSKSSRRSFGIGLGLVFFLFYYILLSAGWVFGEAGTYPPIIGMWIPNLVMAGIGIWILNHTVKENSVVEIVGKFRRMIKTRETCGH
jgi:lipopolysaccharide export system permease protein